MKNTILILLLSTCGLVHAVDGVTIKHSGYVDVNWAKLSTEPSDAARAAGATSYIGIYPLYNDQFTVSMAKLNVSAEVGDSTANIKIGWGPAANALTTGVFGPPYSTQVLEANISHKFGNTGFTFDAGKMQAPVGKEAFEVADNWNYTLSNAIYMEAAYVTGAKVRYSFGDGKYEAGLHVYNGGYAGMYSQDVDKDRGKAMGLSFYAAPIAPLSVYAAYVTTNDIGVKYTHYNIFANYTIIPGLDVSLNYEAREDDPSAPAALTTKVNSLMAYARYKYEKWSVALRHESFKDDGSNVFFHATETKYKVSTITATVGHDVSANLMYRLEYRKDSADKEIYTNKTQAPTKSQDATILAMVMKF